MTGGFLHVTQRDTGVQRSGDERVTQRVWTDALGDAGVTRHAAHDPTGRMTVQALTATTRVEAAWPDAIGSPP